MQEHSLPALRLRATLSKFPSNRSAPTAASVWLLDASGVEDEVQAFFAERLSLSEQQRYAGFVRPLRARQFLLGRILLRIALARLTGFLLERIEVSDSCDHVPQIRFPGANSLRPNFSLSHSREWIACVVSREAKVGIDVEVNDPRRNFSMLSEAVFHFQDHRWLLSLPAESRTRMFYELWSTTEALFKLATNRGSKPASAALVGSDGHLPTDTCDWHRYSLSNSDVTMIVCSDQRLAGIDKIELVDLSPENWEMVNRMKVVKQLCRKGI
jgi:4'-phosphopantetheinyl transferase